jgi:hypothetical protein
MSILKKINNYQKKKNNELNKIINIKKKYTINFDKLEELMYLNMNNNKIIGGNYIFYGIYKPENKLWIWASSIPGVNKKNIIKIKELRNKNYLFENNNDKDILLIYQLLNNDTLIIDNLNLLNLINKVLLFLSDGLIILNPINKSGNIQFIGLINIKEKYVN